MNGWTSTAVLFFRSILKLIKKTSFSSLDISLSNDSHMFLLELKYNGDKFEFIYSYSLNLHLNLL